MNASKSTDDELAWAVVIYLTFGPYGAPPIYLKPRDGGTVWLSGRQETFAEFARRFPRQMDKKRRTKRTE